MDVPVDAQPAQRDLVPPQHFLADLYSFQWPGFTLRLPLMSAGAVALFLFAGVLAGHPGAGLIAGGGAFTVGFGANQRIADSRLLPMLAAVFATSTATLAGTVAGHRDFWLVIAAAVSAFLYGVLTTRNSGMAWVGQQAFVALIVASAFPTGAKPALMRMGLIAAGGLVQVVVTSASLCMMPRTLGDVKLLGASLWRAAEETDCALMERLRALLRAMPALPARDALEYALRLVLTVAAATEIYRRLGIQSGYWIPMTALLVQKPAFGETLTRALARVLGTIAGASLCSLFIVHVSADPLVLAGVTALFALLAYATNPVNYGLFAACLTGYIVFLLALNQIPGPTIAERRAWCTALGAGIALVIHVDALRRLRLRQGRVEAKAA